MGRGQGSGPPVLQLNPMFSVWRLHFPVLSSPSTEALCFTFFKAYTPGLGVGQSPAEVGAGTLSEANTSHPAAVVSARGRGGGWMLP